MSKEARQAAVADITTCLKAGFIRHLIAQRLPLSEIATSHHVVDSGLAISNIVVEIQN